MPNAKECFVISPIGAKGSATRKLADTILKHIIAPAVEPHGYEAIRADQIASPGDINQHVIEHIRDAPLAVAVLHETNPNVYYEMAVRHTLGKPLIPLAPVGAKLPFDIFSIRTVFVDITDLQSANEAREAVVGQLKEFERQGSTVVNPVSQVIRQTVGSG